MALEAQVSSLREQLHETYRMAEKMREERDDAQTAIDQMAASHLEAQSAHETRLTELQQAQQVIWSRYCVSCSNSSLPAARLVETLVDCQHSFQTLVPP